MSQLWERKTGDRGQVGQNTDRSGMPASDRRECVLYSDSKEREGMHVGAGTFAGKEGVPDGSFYFL